MPGETATKAQAEMNPRQQQPASPVVEELAALLEQAAPLTPAIQRAVAQPGQASPADILTLQRFAGNRAVEHLLNGLPAARPRPLIQARLMVGPANDRYEQEADRAAEQVVNGKWQAPGSDRGTSDGRGQPGVQPAGPVAQRQEDEEEVQTKPLAAGITPRVQRQEDEEEVQTKPLLQRRAGGSFEAGDDVAQRLAANRGTGNPLPGNVRADMEPRFGTDFSGVRVHTGSDAADLSRSLSAQAFTVGRDIYMGVGRYDPASNKGKQLLAHELTHTIQQGATGPGQKSNGSHGVIQRKVFSSSDILNAMCKIPIVKESLAKKLTMRHEPDIDKLGPVMKKHVEAVLRNFDTELATGHTDKTKQAMRLAIVLENAARVLAVNELNDPGLTPLIATKLFEFFENEIKRPLTKMDEQADVLNLAKAVVSDDPLALYMHNEIQEEIAANKIIAMAKAVAPDYPAAKMFLLLREKWEAEMATLTREDVRRREDTKATYNVKESTGEISVAYFEKLFGTATPTFMGPSHGRKLTLTPEAFDQLDHLKDEVVRLEPSYVPVVGTGVKGPGRKGLTPKQTQHLGMVSVKDLSAPSRDALVSAALQTDMAMTTIGEADNLRDFLKRHLAELPITINVSGQRWFGSGMPNPKYASSAGRKQNKSYAELFKKRGLTGDIKHLGLWTKGPTETQDRTSDYNRFRYWKDMRETSKLAFSDEELPKFAGVNVVESSQGSQAKELTEYGKGAYGDTWFVMRKEKLAGRAVYTATDLGVPHTDMWQAFCDFVLGGEMIVPERTSKNMTVVRLVINSLITQTPLAYSLQPFEIQIFGDVDVTKDVGAIYMAPTAPVPAKTNAQTFATTHGLLYEESVPPPDVKGTSELVSPTFKNAVKVGLARELTLGH